MVVHAFDNPDRIQITAIALTLDKKQPTAAMLWHCAGVCLNGRQGLRSIQKAKGVNNKTIFKENFCKSANYLVLLRIQSPKGDRMTLVIRKPMFTQVRVVSALVGIIRSRSGALQALVIPMGMTALNKKILLGTSTGSDSALVGITRSRCHAHSALVIPMSVSALNKKILLGTSTGSDSALVGIQTPNLLIRSQMLYSVELRAQVFNFGLQM